VGDALATGLKQRIRGEAEVKRSSKGQVRGDTKGMGGEAEHGWLGEG
jgi:hypothetical protein